MIRSICCLHLIRHLGGLKSTGFRGKAPDDSVRAAAIEILPGVALQFE